MRAVAEARTNIALCKYWGKRPAADAAAARLNLPAVGSLSLTLDGLSTRTEVRFDPRLDADALWLNGQREGGQALARVSDFLDLVRARAFGGGAAGPRAEVRSANSFPTASGLASSASAFAALALAATRAAGLELSPRELSILARQGSGSAARSVLGGVVLLHRGERDDGEDCYAETLLDVEQAEAFGLRMVVAVATLGPKETLSTDGMRHTAATSPFYDAWVQSTEPELRRARAAIEARDLAALGEITERSALTMHASALAARPAVLYFGGTTIEGYRAIRALREREGVPTWFTCDAGPHVKALTDAAHAEQVAARLRELPGIVEVRVCRPGAAAAVLEASA